MREKTVFCCTECGNETINWAGKCPSCGAWNTLKEVKLNKTKKNASVSVSISEHKPKLLSELDDEKEIRFNTDISELNRVLGGGAVRGSVVLVGGAPGIGKSTLLLELCGHIGYTEKVLYITGEESERQLKLRAERLNVSSDKVYVVAETDLNSIMNCIDEVEPDVVIVDSIQTVYDSNIASTAGSITQVRECTLSIMRKTKDSNLTTFIVGHINKEGSIAGPKILEHMVDCVLYFEGDRNTSFRILRAAKNRYGSTNEIGVFEMENTGLKCVDNPSEVLLSGRPANASGTCVTCVLEGTRPILAEIQALLTPSGYNSASRRANGIDYNRVAMLLAVLEKRGRITVSNCDAYVNVVGGLFLDEPAADLATLMAIASSVKDIPLGSDFAAIGEVGLSGEIRSVSSANIRLAEIARLGLKRCLIPAYIMNDIIKPEGLELLPAKNLAQAIAIVFND